MLLRTMSEVNVKSGLKNVLIKIEEAFKRRTSQLEELPQLVAVSKTKPIELIIEAYEAGQRHFGENYVNELADKANHEEIQQRCKDIKWHFIGNLQTNKVNKLLSSPNLYMIETIDDEKLAAKVNASWSKVNKPDIKLNVMIQVNTSKEEVKNGVSPSDTIKLARYIQDNCHNLCLHGLMTIGHLGHNISEGPNPDFISLKQCRDSICKELNVDTKNMHLSMGMSDDFEHAIELGSTNVRVGSLIFGYRDKKT